MAGKKPPFGAVYGRHDFLRGNCSIETRPCALADVAIAARRGVFAESGEQGLAAAASGFTQAHQGTELALLNPLALRGSPALIDLPLAQKNIGVAKEGQRLRRNPSRPARPIS